MVLTFALAGCSSTGANDDGGTENESPAAGASDAEDSASEEAQPSESTTSDSTTSDAAGLAEDADLAKESPAVSPDDAIAAAKDEAKNGTVHAIELDFDRHSDAWQYEVKIIDGTTDYDIEVDADSGEVGKVEKDSTDDKEIAIDLSDPMTFDEALKLAQDKGSGRLESWKLESDDGRVEYQFDFEDSGQETEVTVDVESKRVTIDD